MNTLDNYQEYCDAALENYAAAGSSSRYKLADAVRDLRIKRVLDVGCGPGQDLLQFLERTDASCIGIDRDEKLGGAAITFRKRDSRLIFIRSKGEQLPFADGSFDVVLCRVALPYMNNREAIAEVARVLRPGGVYLLKTHAPRFYFAMIRDRLRRPDARLLAYPLICLAAGFWHYLTGRQMQTGFWQGKEIFQTESFLERELKRHRMKIERRLRDNNPLTPSYVVVKV